MKKLSSPLVLFFVALLFVGASCWTTTVTVNSSNSNSESANAAENTNDVATFDVKVTIDKGTGTPTTYSVKATEGMSALEALNAASADNDFIVVTKQFDFGDLVDSIDGIASADKKFWLFKINGEAATIGASSYAVRDGDSIAFSYGESE